MVLVIGINGTPGSGKTTVAQMLRRDWREVINIGEFAVENGCVIEYDEEHMCNVIDDEKLEESLGRYIRACEKTLIVEGHLADLIPAEFLDRCFVLEVRVPDLIERLRERGYPDKKIEDNKVAELLKDCYINSLDAFGSERVELVPPMPLEELVEYIDSYISSREEVLLHV